jgi:hypothetical protein
MTEGWQQPLRDLGSRGDILKQIHMAICGDPARYHIVREGQALPDVGGASRVLTGRVASKGLSDELKGAFYAVIETPTGHAHHVPLDSRAAEGLRAGDIVSLTTKPDTPVRPVDRQIAEVARLHAGVYAVGPAAAGTSHPHARRLRDLERLGLAAAEGHHRWKVSPNLLEALEERQRGTPVRHRLFLRKQPLSLGAQVDHPGPVWLDRVNAESLAPYGFGADLRRAVEQRREALRRLGVQPDDPLRTARGYEVGRRAVGEGIAGRSGHVFLADTPDWFRGRVRVADAGPSGASYAVVSDGKHFIVLRETAGLRAAQGKTVTVTRGSKGQLVVRTLEKDRGQ